MPNQEVPTQPHNLLPLLHMRHVTRVLHRNPLDLGDTPEERLNGHILCLVLGTVVYQSRHLDIRQPLDDGPIT